MSGSSVGPVASLAAPWNVHSNQAHVGLNVAFNGTDFLTGADGSSNGGVLLVAGYNPETFDVVQLVSTGGTSQVIAPGSLPGPSFRVSQAGVLQGWGSVAGALVDMTPDTGSFTGTFQGFAGGDPTSTVEWTRNGNQVSLLFLGGSGTSNANSFKMTGLPSYLIPATTKIIDISGAGITNGGATVDAGAGKVAVNINNAGLSGLIQFLLGGGANGWTTSGNKGIVTPTEIFYSLA